MTNERSHDDTGRPQTLNRYSYVMNNPLRYTDPSGWDIVADVLNSRGEVVGTIRIYHGLVTLPNSQPDMKPIEIFDPEAPPQPPPAQVPGERYDYEDGKITVTGVVFAETKTPGFITVNDQGKPTGETLTIDASAGIIVIHTFTKQGQPKERYCKIRPQGTP